VHFVTLGAGAFEWVSIHSRGGCLWWDTWYEHFITTTHYHKREYYIGVSIISARPVEIIA